MKNYIKNLIVVTTYGVGSYLLGIYLGRKIGVVEGRIEAYGEIHNDLSKIVEETNAKFGLAKGEEV